MDTIRERSFLSSFFHLKCGHRSLHPPANGLRVIVFLFMLLYSFWSSLFYSFFRIEIQTFSRIFPPLVSYQQHDGKLFLLVQ